MLYHVLIVRLSPIGPKEPSARREWWTTDRHQAGRARRRAKDVRTAPFDAHVTPSESLAGNESARTPSLERALIAIVPAECS